MCPRCPPQAPFAPTCHRGGGGLGRITALLCLIATFWRACGSVNHQSQRPAAKCCVVRHYMPGWRFPPLGHVFSWIENDREFGKSEAFGRVGFAKSDDFALSSTHRMADPAYRMSVRTSERTKSGCDQTAHEKCACSFGLSCERRE